MVLKSYEQFSATGWEIVLENVKERVKGKIAGNALYINKIKDYYRQTSSKATVKCIQRIANQYMQKCVRPPHDHQIALMSHTESMSEAIRQRAGDRGLPIGLPRSCRTHLEPRQKVCMFRAALIIAGMSPMRSFRVTLSRRKVLPFMTSPGSFDLPG